ncbi:MAG: substrate-binding domain-containing protein [Planctomycetales bacterium]|nr:substrate-binding domain-containing protein [Planctomycetales bacterium]
MTSHSSNGRWSVLLPVFAALVLAGFWLSGPSREEGDLKSLVVYCAHDSVYADAILKDFEKQSGIRVDVRYDTEATKSLGLVNLIVSERQRPRCDVFWNNELLGTVDLQAQGLLEPHKGTGWERLPEKYRDSDGHWVGFAARLRVQIVNTREVSADDEVVQNLFAFEPASVAVAKPLFGTTLTHYTVLWNEWGPERLKEWHHDLRLRGVREVDGNGAVKDLVAQGVCSAGLTDTDDFFVALDEGKPVEMLPVEMLPVRVLLTPSPQPGEEGREAENKSEVPLTLALSPQSRGEGTKPKAEKKTESKTKTICIPNTVAIIKGTKRVEAARKLIDFLASAETELALARSKSRQVPLGPVDEAQLPDEVRRLNEWAADGVDLRSLLPARRECLEWLKSEYLR